METSTEGSARRRVQPLFPAFLQDSRAVVLKGSADQEPLGTSPSVQCIFSFFPHLPTFVENFQPLLLITFSGFH